MLTCFRLWCTSLYPVNSCTLMRMPRTTIVNLAFVLKEYFHCWKSATEHECLTSLCSFKYMCHNHSHSLYFMQNCRWVLRFPTGIIRIGLWSWKQIEYLTVILGSPEVVPTSNTRCMDLSASPLLFPIGIELDSLNTLRPRHNWRHFADGTLNVFVDWKYSNLD